MKERDIKKLYKLADKLETLNKEIMKTVTEVTRNPFIWSVPQPDTLRNIANRAKVLLENADKIV